MTDRVLLSANPGNIRECVALAVEHGLGIELMAFAFPAILDGDVERTVDEYRALLEPVRGMLTLHGPFMDMAPGSPDARVNAVVRERYQHAVRIGQALGCELIVLHANFIASIQTESYREGWHRRNLVFWREMADYARAHDLVIALENMWEFDPDITGDVVKEIDHPSLRACIDVGHAHLFSRVPFEDWLTSLGPYLVHIHMNNNDGALDIHRALPDGVLAYPALLRRLRALPTRPTFTLEMETVEDMRASLPLLDLTPPLAPWRARVPTR